MLTVIKQITAQIYDVILSGIKCTFRQILQNAEEMLMKRTNDPVVSPRCLTSHSQIGSKGRWTVCVVSTPAEQEGGHPFLVFPPHTA